MSGAIIPVPSWCGDRNRFTLPLLLVFNTRISDSLVVVVVVVVVVVIAAAAAAAVVVVVVVVVVVTIINLLAQKTGNREKIIMRL